MTSHHVPANQAEHDDPDRIEAADVEEVVPSVDDVIETFDHDGVVSPAGEAQAPAPG